LRTSFVVVNQTVRLPISDCRLPIQGDGTHVLRPSTPIGNVVLTAFRILTCQTELCGQSSEQRNQSKRKNRLFSRMAHHLKLRHEV